MKKFTHLIAAKAIKEHQSVNDLKVRARYGALEGWASIIINLLLFVVKIVLGLSVRSVVFDIALEEDAVEKKTGKLNLSQQCRDLPMNS